MSVLDELRHALAENLVRSGLDVADDILILAAFLHDLRWKEAAATPRELAADWLKVAASANERHFLKLYIHFPYCRSRCLFCMYSSSKAPSREAVSLWVGETVRELEHFARAARSMPVRSFMVGGGSPSLMSEDALSAALGAAFKLFRFDDHPFISIECNPESATREKLRLLRRPGFLRVSMGVQSLDPAVLKRVGRGYQSAESVAAAFSAARAAGFDDVNLDLVWGFRGETRESFVEGFRRVAALRPESITICGLTPIDGYLRAEHLTREEFARDYAERLPEAMLGLAEAAREQGYGGDDLGQERGVWTLLRSDIAAGIVEKLKRAAEQDGDPCSILGVGPGSRSHLFARALARRGLGSFGADAPLYAVSRLSIKDEMAIYALYSIEIRGMIDRARFIERFGRDVMEIFNLELAVLSSWKQVEIDAVEVRFLPKSPASRIYYGQAFLLEALAARDRGLDGGLLERVRRECGARDAVAGKVR